jgi:hypothetical protein
MDGRIEWRRESHMGTSLLAYRVQRVSFGNDDFRNLFFCLESRRSADIQLVFVHNHKSTSMGITAIKETPLWLERCTTAPFSKC